MLGRRRKKKKQGHFFYCKSIFNLILLWNIETLNHYSCKLLFWKVQCVSVWHILSSQMTSYILRAFVFSCFDTTLQDMSEKIANAGKNNSLQSGNSRISLYLTTQQNEFRLFYDTVASLEQKSLTCAPMGCMGSN